MNNTRYWLDKLNNAHRVVKANHISNLKGVIRATEEKLIIYKTRLREAESDSVSYNGGMAYHDKK